MRLFAIWLLVFTSCFMQRAAIAHPLAYVENFKNARLLDCKKVNERINAMIDIHYYFNEFNIELSNRTIEKIFESLDPDKIYFQKSDLIYFKNKEKNIGDKIKQENCSFLFNLKNLFLTRVHDTNSILEEFLTKRIDFSKDDFFINNKNEWSINTEEIKNKLRKKIKLQFISMNEINDKEADTRAILLKNYKQIEKKLKEFDDDKFYSILINSFALSLDPHSNYLPPLEYENFVIHMSNKLEGIGIKLEEKNGYVIIKSLVKGGVAQKDGRLKPKDIIIAIDAGNGLGIQKISDLNLDQVINLIRGKKGSYIKLMIVRKSKIGTEKINVDLVREEINLKENQVISEVINFDNKKIGVIKIPTFYTDFDCKVNIFYNCKGVSFDVEKNLKRLVSEGINGVLLDLRNNGGGDFLESIKLLSLFIPRGVAVQTVDKSHSINKFYIEDSKFIYKGSVVVLVNKYSASASEVFAGAMQDYARGIIVGDYSTYGKATVQIIQEIIGTNGRKIDGSLKVTQSKFYRPGGKSNQVIGVRSDILAPSILDAYKIGESEQDYALTNDSIPKADEFKPLYNVSNLVKKLQILSKNRIDNNKKYIEFINNILRIKKERNESFPITSKFIKKIEEQNLNNDEIINDNSIIDKDDLQLMEAINITKDSIDFFLNDN